MENIIVYCNRDPNEEDWKTVQCLFVNKNTDSLFVKASKGWLKIPTQYSVLHNTINQPERSKREDSHCINCFELEKACDNCFSGDGTCFKCGRLVRCGALNIVETQ